MTREEYVEAVNELGTFGKNAEAALREFQKEHDGERDAYPDQEVERWTAKKKASRERYTKSEVEEIRSQAAQEVRDRRAHSAGVLDAALALAEAKAAGVEAYAEELRPDWMTVATGDFSRAMYRMGDDFAAQATRQQLEGASWRTIARVYHEAVTQNDPIVQRVIEGTVGPHAFPVATARPDLADIAALFTLVQTIKAERRRRHPEAAVTLRATIAAVRNDSTVRRYRHIKAVDAGRRQTVAA